MRRLAIIALLPLAAFVHAGTATFDDLSYAGSATYENGSHLSGSFVSGGLSFNNAYNSAYGGYWSNFAYSKVQNDTTAGSGNQYAAYAGNALSGSSYGVSYGSNATITLPSSDRISGMYVTNTTYAALSMLNGDQFGKKFDVGDFFILTATGYAGGVATGSASFALADYRSATPSARYIVKNWSWFDLSGLGAATQIKFSYASSDVGQYGINTPTYFALDNVGTLPTQAVPEPMTFAALGFGLAVVARRRKGVAK